MLFDTFLEIEFEPSKKEHALFYNHSDNFMQKYKKRALRCEFSKEEELFYDMLIDIKKDLQKLTQKPPKPLLNRDFITKIDYDCFEIENAKFKPQTTYFARIFFDDLMYLYFEAMSEKCAKIIKIKKTDDVRLAGYIVGIQRMLINQRSKDDK